MSNKILNLIKNFIKLADFLYFLRYNYIKYLYNLEGRDSVSLIEDLYGGSITPEADYICNTDEYKEAVKKKSAIEASLLVHLDDESKKVFEDYCDARLVAESIDAKELYIYAFKMGARFMLECLTDVKNEEKE